MTFKAKLVIFVQVEDDYGQTRLKARIGRTLHDADEYGIPFAPCKWSIGGFDPGAEFDGFEASAYIGYTGFGNNEPDRGIWGLNMYYTDVRIENATQAMRIARAFAKIEKGMSDLNTKEGYLKDDSDPILQGTLSGLPAYSRSMTFMCATLGSNVKCRVTDTGRWKGPPCNGSAPGLPML